MVYDRVPKPPDLPEGLHARFIRPGDEEGILRVLTESFPRWPKLDCSVTPLEHLRWKLSSHPRAEKMHVVVESPDGLVGARLEWAFETKVGDGTLLVREPVDRAVKPTYQRKYAMSAMRVFGRELRDTTFDMNVSYGSGATGMRNLRKYRLPDTKRYYRVLEVLVCDLDATHPRTSSQTAWQIRTIDVFDKRFDALWANAADQFPFAVVRSSAYLNWRYADRRAGDYVVLAAEESGRWLGYVVLRASEETGYIADLLALPGRIDVAESLLSAASDRFRGGSQRHAECWSESHSVYRWALDRAGFRQYRRSIALTLRPLSFPAEEASFLGDPAASILFSAGDTDLV